MTAQRLLAEPIDLDAVRSHVTRVLGDFLSHKAAMAVDRRMPCEVTDVLGDFLQPGGKRLRPMLAVAGYHAAGGHGDMDRLLGVAASLEMFHASALIHDDVMDCSSTRRGHPTAHRTMTAHHGPGRNRSSAEQVGTSSAILLGDLALVWSDELLHTADLTDDQLARVLPLLDSMRSEVMYGQYLDITSTGRPTTDLERAMAVCRYKTANYTCERPLQIGAALAADAPDLLHTLSTYAVPLGEAFQLRDDLLGVFGDPGQTGKPALDDLRAGKHTALTALALQQAHPTQADQLRDILGQRDLTDDQADAARHILTTSGARDEVEDMIKDRLAQAQRALSRASLPPPAETALLQIAEAATKRLT